MLWLLAIWFGLGCVAYGLTKGSLSFDYPELHRWSDEGLCWLLFAMGCLGFVIAVTVVALFGRFSFRLFAPRKNKKERTG